jgi:hypothetical protein
VDNDQKWELRRRRGSDITIGSDGTLEHIDWSTIKRWQEEFQRDYCSQCVRDDGPRNERGDCASHWTDIVGQCWNFQSREAA